MQEVAIYCVVFFSVYIGCTVLLCGFWNRCCPWQSGRGYYGPKCCGVYDDCNCFPCGDLGAGSVQGLADGAIFGLIAAVLAVVVTAIVLNV